MKTVQQRFWSKVDKNGPVIRVELGPCWVWTAAMYGRGYGHFYVGNGRHAAAHVFSLEESLGRRLGEGKRGLHKCDNRVCVNPLHLFEGTQRDNILDMIAKGRGNLQAKAQAGEKNPRAKIKVDDVVRIRKLSADGMAQKEIGRMVGLTQGVVSKIVRRAIWKDVP